MFLKRMIRLVGADPLSDQGLSLIGAAMILLLVNR